jgi:hypothetical protein
MGGGYELTGRDFIGGGNQHANTLQLQLRLLSSGVICRHGCSQAVTAQHAYDQFRLRAAGDDRHGYCRTVHDPDSLLPSPSRAYWQHGRASGGQPRAATANSPTAVWGRAEQVALVFVADHAGAAPV